MLTPDREAELLGVIAAKDQQIEGLRVENKLLREKIDLLVRRVFGGSSEKLDAAQMEMLLGLEAGALAKKAPPAGGDTPAVEPRAPRQQRRPRLPEHLPVEEEVSIPLEVQAQPEAWREIGAEVREQLDYRPARYVRRRLVRKKYVRIDAPHRPPVIAPLPPSLQDGCLAAPAMIAHVIVGKFCDHLPLYRQEQRLKWSHGIELPRQTMMRWLALAVFWLRPIYEMLKTTVLDGDYVQVDETPIRYLDPGGGRCKLGYFWTVLNPKRGVFYHWEPSRAAACLEQIIPAGFRGTLQCDGYAAYPRFARQRQLDLAGCWAHVRRKFHESMEAEPRRAGWVLWQLGHLYRIEAALRDQGAGPALRAAVRASHSRMVVQRLGRVLRQWQSCGKLRPRSNFGAALAYTLGLWEPLSRFLELGEVEIDNNLDENAIRTTALGKKNWLFAGNETSGENLAILYTLAEECRRLQLDPQAYFTEVLTRIPSATNHTVHTLTPAALSVHLPRFQPSLPIAHAA